MESVKECLPYLKKNVHDSIKEMSSKIVMDLTCSAEGAAFLLNDIELLSAVLELTTDADNHQVAKNALFCLINIMSYENLTTKAFEVIKSQSFPLVPVAIKEILNENSPNADYWVLILKNATRAESVAHEVAEELLKDENSLSLLVTDAFCNTNYNKCKCHLDFLGQLFGNLSQTREIREFFCRKRFDLLEKLLPFTQYESTANSDKRRSGIVSMLLNISFEESYLDVMLNEKDDIMVALLLPLMGPEEYDDEEQDKFPIDLQYLKETKLRESNSSIRLCILEALLQLCATKKGREWMRAKGVYEILREYHKWEEQSNCLLACENVVDILIKKEEEIGLDDYRKVEVPADLAERFKQEDQEYLKNA